MKRRYGDAPLPAHDRPGAATLPLVMLRGCTFRFDHGLAMRGNAVFERHAGEHAHAGPDLLDEGGPDEHRVHRAALDPLDVEVGLEGLELAAEGVPAHRQVDCAEAELVGPPVEHAAGEQDHPGAGAECRNPVAKPRRELGRARTT